ncbi:MAG TPA: serine hydrolase domain-containing protein [Steroidobacteraceae bacterium]|jgi:CubicO group peptidase (beta-lactamase class C family)|nr:serine hydrolase domain-containing protein [Steroidobacteraceae bacterium]
MIRSGKFGGVRRLCTVLGLLLTAAPPCWAAAPAAHELNREDLEAFFDGIIPLQLERSDVAGATVLVMHGSDVLLQKGYGFSDVKAKQAVDPESTMFRLASISKLFTWTAAMQLVEQGKLDLDVGIDRYLDFPMGAPQITLRNLMTHTTGLEEVARNIIVTDPKQYMALREFLIEDQPHRLFAPGTIPEYSNYAVGLGSYIVQRVSGERFEDYVAAHIFSPLGMTHSTFYQLPPSALQKLPSQGYPSSTSEAPIGFELFSPAGAGGLSSSAADMGRFGQMLLNGGELDGQRILKPETLAEMWKPQFRASDQLPAMGLGFYQAPRNQLKWIGHQGDLVAFHSLFYVEPRQKLVLFISYNSAGSAGKTRPELLNAFSDRYFPAESQQSFIKLPQDKLKDIEGTYQSTRRSDSTILRLFALVGQAHAKIDKDGVLHVDKSKDLRGHPFAWKPVGTDLWQQVDDQGKFFAIRDQSGRIERLAGSFPAVQLQRVSWYEQDKLVLMALGFTVLVGICVLFNVLLRLARRYVFRSSQPVAPADRAVLGAWTKAAAIYWLVLFVAVTALFSRYDENTLPPTSAWDKYFLLGDVLFVIAVALSVFAVVSTARIWRRPATSRVSQIKFTLVALACAYASWFAIHWHLITPVHRF